MSITFTGVLNGIDNYNKIRIIVDDPKVITDRINDLINPYHKIGSILECLVIPIKHKEYYIDLANNFKNRKVTVEATIKRYCFNEKKGTSLILKQLSINDINL